MSNPEAFRDVTALEKETGKIAILKKHIETLHSILNAIKPILFARGK